MKPPPGRPFAPGNQFGQGRPKGSRNKGQSAEQELLEQHAVNITKRCIAEALKGEKTALRLCMERLLPARRANYIRMSLPAIDTLQDLERAAEKVLQGIGRGKMRLEEGEPLMRMLESRSRLIATAELEQRLEKLEAASGLKRAA